MYELFIIVESLKELMIKIPTHYVISLNNLVMLICHWCMRERETLREKGKMVGENLRFLCLLGRNSFPKTHFIFFCCFDLNKFWLHTDVNALTSLDRS
jgi:hypothetical protein